MRNTVGASLGHDERGAVKITTVLWLSILLIVVFLAIKISPVYIEQKEIAHEVEELARKASVRNTEKDKIQKEIADLEKRYSLKDGSITIATKEVDNVSVAVKYTVPIDFWVTRYDWKCDYRVQGKGF